MVQFMTLILTIESTENEKDLISIIEGSFPDSIIFSANEILTGIELAIEKDPDVIILGKLTNNAEQIEFCSHVKNDKRLQDIPLIFLTSNQENIDIRREAIKSGADALISYPLDDLELTALIRLVAKIKKQPNTKTTIDEEANFHFHTGKSLKQMSVSTEKDILKLVHELEVHQIELELQNEELRIAKKREAELASEKHVKLYDFAPTGYFTFSRDGEIVDLNLSGAKTLGKDRSHLKNSHFILFVTENTKAIFDQFLYNVFTSKSKQNCEIELADTENLTTYVHLSGIINEDGDFCNVNLLDITETKRTEKLIKDNNSRLELAMQSAQLAWWNMDIKTGHISFDRRKAEMLGYQPEIFKYYNDFIALVHPEDSEKVMDAMHKHLIGLSDKYEVEYRIMNQSGTYLWFNDLGEIEKKDSNGNPLTVMGIVNDITGRKKTEAKLRKSEANILSAVKAVGLHFYEEERYGSDRKYSFPDKKTISLMGLSTIQNNRIYDFWKEHIHPDDLQDVLTNQGLGFEKGLIDIVSMEYRYFNDEMGMIWIHHIIHALERDKSGQILHLVGAIQDITEQKKVELKLIKSEEKFRSIFKTLQDAYLQTDINGNFVLASPSAVRMFGFESPEEIEGTSAAELYANISDRENMLKKLDINGNITDYIVEGKKKNGTRFWISINAQFIYENGNITGIIGVIRDITERKKSEDKINTLTSAVEQSQLSIVITDINGDIEYVNPKFSEISGYANLEVIGKNLSLIKSGNTTDLEYQQLWETISSGRNWKGEFVNRKKNEEYFYQLASISPVIDQNNQINHYIAIMEDITNQKQATEKIRMLSTVVEQSPIMIVITNDQYITEYANKEYIEFTQFSLDEIIGTIPFGLNPVNWLPESFVRMQKMIKRGEVWQLNLLNHKKDGTAFHENLTIFPLQDSNHKITNYILIKEDITEKKQLIDDLIGAKEKAEESDRLKTSFLSNMSHEIRTPLNSIIGFSELLLETGLKTEQQTKFILNIKKSGDALLSIISDIVDISLIETGQVKLINYRFSINNLISDIYNEYTYKKEETKIEFRLDLPDPTTTIFIENDEARIRQILTNFINNSFKFTKKGFIEIGLKKISDGIQIHVKDTGIGIPKESHKIIFERFHQLETSHTRKYCGNGLGLTISRQLADLLGGKIWMESEPGKGSTFYLSLNTEQNT